MKMLIKFVLAWGLDDLLHSASMSSDVAEEPICGSANSATTGAGDA